MSMKELTKSIDRFILEWISSEQRVAQIHCEKSYQDLAGFVSWTGLGGLGLITQEASEKLNEAAIALLEHCELSEKVASNYARECIKLALKNHLKKAIQNGYVSEHAVAKKSVEELRRYEQDDGFYIFPLIFAPKAMRTDLYIGPARIVSKAIFHDEMAGVWNANREDAKGHFQGVVDEWQKDTDKYDHFVIVEIYGYQEEMAWSAARHAADALLNIIRMFYRFSVMRKVRLGGSYTLQEKTSALRLSIKGTVSLRTNYDFIGSILQDEWQEAFEKELSEFYPLLAQSVSQTVEDEGRKCVMRERFVYFHRLISEAYCEPDHPIRLVRLISALEAISMIEQNDKSNVLASRCASVGSWGSAERSSNITRAVSEAYKKRNEIVHGDAPKDKTVIEKFHQIEKYLFHIYLGFMRLHAEVDAANPSASVRKVRQKFRLNFLNADL